MTKGDLVLVPFPFSDLSGRKLRPALVLFCDETDVLCAFITSNTGNTKQFDLILTPEASNGLKVQSMLRLSKIACLAREIVIGKLGKVSDTQARKIDDLLLKMLKIKE
jgi:mRNA interferase MazF